MLPAPKVKRATVVLPGDKSISHRAFLLAAMASGFTTIVNPNLGQDVIATIAALRQAGVRVWRTGAGYRVAGCDELRSSAGTIDCANSGTTMRLLMGMLAGRMDAVLDGDASLRRRPMARVADPLNLMGARITTGRQGRPPVRLRRQPQRLRPVRYTLRVASAQVKSAILLAALRATGPSRVVEAAITRNHTEIMLRAMGANVMTDGKTIRIEPSRLSSPGRLRIPGDFSSAVYLLCAAAALPGGRLRLRDVGINPTRSAALDVMRSMGAQLDVVRRRSWAGEPLADIVIAGGASLHNVTIPKRAVPILIDEIPALCALASVAGGTLIVSGARELKVKESDRIHTTVDLLCSFGADAQARADGIVVHGRKPLHACARISTRGDHRIGLAAVVLAAATQAPLQITESECIATSFPSFRQTWEAAFGRRS